MTCRKCGSPMVLDLASAIELARRGFQGGRVYCRLGCSDVWVLTARPPKAPAVQFPEPDLRGRWERPVRTHYCVTCGSPFATRGCASRSKWCGPCRSANARERDHQRWLARRLPRSAAR
jgi:hypothetical protein